MAKGSEGRVKGRFAPGLRALVRPVDSLSTDAANARHHGERNLAAIRESLRAYGQQKPIVVDAAGVVIAGSGTLEAAMAEGWTHVAAIESDLVGAKRRGYAIADNRTAELAEWNDEVLDEQLRELLAAGDFEGTGFEPEEIAARVAKGRGAFDEPIDELDFSEVHDEFWISVRGPLPQQPDALEALREALEALPGVTVRVGSTQLG